MVARRRDARRGRARSAMHGEWRIFLRQFDTDWPAPGCGHRRSSERQDHGHPALRRGFRLCGSRPRRLVSSPRRAARPDASRSAHRRYARKVADRRLAISLDAASVRFGLGVRRGKAGAVRSRGGLADRFADASARPRAGAGRRPAGDGLGRQLRAEVQGRQDRRSTITKLSRALAVRPDASGFALGADCSLRAFDAKGKQRWKQRGAERSLGRRLLARTARSSSSPMPTARSAGCAGSDGAELLALFVEPPSRKWVAWTPTGYYMASAGGEDLIGWHLNRGWDARGRFLPRLAFLRAVQPARHRASWC